MAGLLDISGEEMERLRQLMSDMGNNVQQMPLDYEALLKSGAMRITQPGDGKGGFETNNNPNHYSIVSAYNDAQPDTITKAWPNKPESYETALRDLRENSTGPLYDGKYRQMLWSAQQKGLTNYFMPDRRRLGR